MLTKIGINGFGRIGRLTFRAALTHDDVEVVALNDPFMNPEYMAYMLKYDSVHGKFPGTVEAYDGGLIVNGKKYPVFTSMEVKDIPWASVGAEYICECTGKHLTKDLCQGHIDAGVKHVVMGAPSKDDTPMFVMGVNQDIYDPAAHDVVSAASCTTNCLAPAAKVIAENFGIRHGLMTTIHSYTMSQRILDGSHKDARRSRAAAVSMIPTSTGAAKAIGKVYPALKGKLDGMAVRVPTPDVSLVDFTAELERETDAAAVNAALKAAAAGPLGENMGYSEEPLVSVDYVGSTYGGVVDSLLTTVMDKTMLKLIIWYDNEAGFTNQLLRLVRLVGVR